MAKWVIYFTNSEKYYCETTIPKRTRSINCAVKYNSKNDALVIINYLKWSNVAVPQQIEE